MDKRHKDLGPAVRGARPEDRTLRRLLKGLVAVNVAWMIVVSGVGYVAISNTVSRNELDESSYGNDLRACQRGNDTRRVWNRTAPAIRQDVRNLELLSQRLARTRKLEARFFLAVTAASPADTAAVRPLVDIYRRAGRFDRGVRRRQNRIDIQPFEIVRCLEVVERP